MNSEKVVMKRKKSEDLNNILRKIDSSNLDFNAHFSKVKLDVAKIISERKTAAYVPEEKLQATITL